MSLVRDVGFVHLHVRSAYSLREGALGIAKLSKLAAADGAPAVALTDANNLFGALEFSEKLAAAGIQPIIGLRLAVEFGDIPAARGPQRFLSRPGIVLLAQTEEGYRNLMRLSSRAFLDPTLDEPHVSAAALVDAMSGLVCLTGGPEGPLDRLLRAGLQEAAIRRLALLEETFGDRLYVELQRHGLDAEKRIEPALIDLAYRRGLPLAATNEVYFAAASDYEAHDALLCLAQGVMVGDSDRRRVTPEHRLKSRAEMTALFADLPEATDNTVEIAMRVAFRPRTGKPILPRFTVGSDDEAVVLRRQAEDGLAARLTQIEMAPGLTRADYEARLSFELDVIEKMRFPGYFLIVADFIKYAKSQGIPVGPGRGSGAGSLVAFALTITDLDPIRFGLLFERFLNPERVSMPDFDIDFCQTRRGEVIEYVRGRYGVDRVAQIITFGSFLARGCCATSDAFSICRSDRSIDLPDSFRKTPPSR